MFPSVEYICENRNIQIITPNRAWSKDDTSSIKYEILVGKLRIAVAALDSMEPGTFRNVIVILPHNDVPRAN